MNWQNLIEQQSHYTLGDYNKLDSNTLIPLPGYGLIQITGKDAATFLQNLLTNDVNSLQVNQSQLSGLCNPKGRLMSIFRLVKRDHDYVIILPAELTKTIIERLQLFKLRSKVDINLLENSHVLGLVYSQIEPDLAETWQAQNIKAGLVIPQPGHMLRSLIIADHDDIDTLSKGLNQNWKLAPEAYWQLLEIEAGLPMIFSESQEVFTPQQVNLDLIGAVSFKKGCYPGQEVVARLHYLGSPSRRLFLGKFDDDTLPIINSPVVSADGDTLGHIVQAQFTGDKTIVCQLSMKLTTVGKTALINNQQLKSLIPLIKETENY